SALDRVKAYLSAFEDGAGNGGASALQYPDYPLFPGLRNRPFHEAGELPGIAMLEAEFDMIRAEWASLADSAYLKYAPSSMHSLWLVYLLRYMGVRQPPQGQQCPGTQALLSRIPGICLDYPWGDALFSVHASDAHLRAHCSVDNLRVRCHLALQVPSGCSIRVGEETRQWQEGKALVFEDSFEHEVWNRGNARRAILIVDFWHPDLTRVEREALTAGFRKLEVRRQFMFKRLQAMQSCPPAVFDHLSQQAAVQEHSRVQVAYWRTPEVA
ncbi:MAG: aspartyl/asparaginyl beta-hydroxylase domain-containing protein, partial [Comamonadaceae bacterium]